MLRKKIGKLNNELSPILGMIVVVALFLGLTTYWIITGIEFTQVNLSQAFEGEYMNKIQQSDVRFDKISSQFNQIWGKDTAEEIDGFIELAKENKLKINLIAEHSANSNYQNEIQNLMLFSDSLQHYFTQLQFLNPANKKQWELFEGKILMTFEKVEESFSTIYEKESKSLQEKLDKFDRIYKRSIGVSVVYLVFNLVLFVFFGRRVIRNFFHIKERELSLSNEIREINSFLFKMPTAIAILENETGIPVYLNEKFSEMFNTTNFPEAGTIIKNIGTITEMIPETDGIIQEEGNWISKSGEKYYFVRTVVPIEIDKKQYRMENFTDITIRHRFEKKLKASEKYLKQALKTNEQFISIISHDIRSPLSGVLGLSEVMAERTRDLPDKSLHNYSMAIHRSVSSTFQMLNNLLEWSKVKSGNVGLTATDFDLNDLVMTNFGYYSGLAAQANVELRNRLNEPFLLHADENMMSTVLRNLISNALKFTPAGGSVSVNATLNNNDAVVQVTDTGTGMTREQMKPLFSTKKYQSGKGGLGLLLCKEMIEKHQGTIKVESEPGKGSTFIVRIPVKQKTAS